MGMITQEEKELIIRMSQGNPGAVGVLARLMQSDYKSAVAHLDEQGIYGPAIWVCFKDLGDETIDTLVLNIIEGSLKERLAQLGY